jgi:Immunity protein Imm1
MTTPRLRWTPDGDATEVATVEALDALLDRLSAEAARGRPLMVELTASNGDLLSMGLGRPKSVLSYTPASLDPPYFASHGHQASDQLLVYDYAGEPTEFPVRQAVPISAAREGFRRFFVTGTLPDTIEWEDV